MFQNFMNICIIPARSGSKRVKKKNIKNFLGKPIIYYPIREAIKSKLFKNIIVSTDSDEIIKISKKFGAEVFFKRSKKLSKNNVSTQKIVKNEISKLKKINLKFDNICCIYPTAVLLKAKHLKKSFNSFKKSKKNFLFSAQKFISPPQRALIRKKGKIQMMNPKNYFIQSNNLEKTYHDAGQFYWGDTNSWTNEKIVFSKKSDIYILPFLEAIDINYKEDWKIAEFLYKNHKKI